MANQQYIIHCSILFDTGLSRLYKADIGKITVN